MGLLGQLLFGIPLKLGREVFLSLKERIDAEMLLTEESIKERLQQLQLLLQEGEMTEEEYEALEDGLIQRLRAVRQYPEVK